MHFPLRPGTPVLIGFVQGDPDLPVVVGGITDAETPSPVERPNQTQNVLRTGAANELVIEDLAGSERIRAHTPHERTTLQLGAAEEPEEGALLATEASITAAAARSINEVTARKVSLCGTSTALAGDSAVLLAGVEGLLPAMEEGVRRIGAVERRCASIVEGLERLAEPPGGEGEDGGEGEGEGGGGEGEGEGGVLAGAARFVGARRGGGAGDRLWSDLAAHVDVRARRAAMQAVCALARAADAHLAGSAGRLAGAPLEPPEGPSAIVGSAETAALFGRRSAFVFGDHAAALASDDTASVVGGALSQLKSPIRVEVAGGEAARLTSAGAADVEADTVRVAGGYFPDRETPSFRPTTSVGVIALRELELVSGEDCVLVCAEKNVLLTAHRGSIELQAAQHASLAAGSVAVSAGPIRVTSTADIRVLSDGSIEVEAAGDVRVKAGGKVTVEGTSVEVSAESIALNAPVKILGDLSVGGTVNGKRL
jgi:hypothetical protein